MSNEKPILFSGPMVQAILAGRKIQTRRVVKPQPLTDGKAWACYWERPNHNGQYGPSAWGLDEKPCDSMLGHCPYGRVGDRLWVRETWHYDGGNNRELEPGHVSYRADGEFLKHFKEKGAKWRPSIFMPRWASRITLEITSVKVERLQEMTGKDVAAEGFPFSSDLDQFKLLWEKLNGKGSWELNPWVWAISFRRLESQEVRQ